MLKYKLRRISKSKLIIWSTFILLFFVSIGSIVNYYASSVDFDLKRSGIEGDTVYVNDFVSDLDYYTGLNYTEVTSRSELPGNNNGKYTKDKLVAVQLTYDGHDINNDELIGYVSGKEAQYKYVYYKYYPIDPETNTIKIELLDNPYSARPTGYGFNGWVCDTKNVGSVPCEDLTFSYDADYYVRYLTVAAPTADSEGNRKLIINLKTSWTAAKIYQTISNDSADKTLRKNVNNALNEKGMYNAITQNGNNFYNYNEENEEQHFFDENTSMVGYYYKLNSEDEYDSTRSYLYYNNFGVSCQNTSCRISGTNKEDGIYKLIQTNDSEKQIISKNEDGTYSTNYDINRYYYLATRDTNIVELTINIKLNNLFSTATPKMERSLTLTSSHDGKIKNTDKYLEICPSTGCTTTNITYDFALENIAMDGVKVLSSPVEAHQDKNPGNINANGKNLKIGRNVTTKEEGKYTFQEVISGFGSGGESNTKSKVIVESGRYNMLFAGSVVAITNNNSNIISQYGSDYDRVADNGNYNLIVNNSIRSSTKEKTVSSGILPTTSMIVKSGIYGNYAFEKGIGSCISSDGNASYHTYGIYVTAPNSSNSASLRTLKVEGGKIFNINGGVDIDRSIQNQNVVAIYMTGGDVQNVSGGGAINEAYGNRIVSITGGMVNNSVAGGNNSSVGDTNGAGPLYGSTLVYIGGSAKIGGSPVVSELYGISEVGSVFGAGLGRENNSVLGQVANSSIIINGGTISGDIYGGGNYGAVGVLSSYDAASTSIKIYAGEIGGNVFGASNSNGFSNVDYRNQSSITIDVEGGEIGHGVYGGANSSGPVYGSVSININEGKIDGNVYGAGYGSGTSLIGEISINSSADINAIYGGSSRGKVGSEDYIDQRYTNTITINGGKVNEVYGGSEGSESEITIPIVYGDSIVSVNNGDIGSIYGGNNIRGFITGTSNVNIYNGTVDEIYGGSNGNNTSAADTNVALFGGKVGNVYGGGKSAPANSTKIEISGTASVDNVYGGSNQAGLVNTSNIVASRGKITCNVYGGGQSAPVINSNVNLKGAEVTPTNYEGKAEESACGNLFGGGKSANVTSSNIIVDSGTVLNVYGGSNETGVVEQSNITINSGVISNVFGGNNKGGTTDSTNIVIKDGQISGDVFGGGNNAPVNKNTVVTMYGGSVNSVYGGGNKSYIGRALIKDNGELNPNYNTIDYEEGSTEVNIVGGTINKNVYGSGNTSFVYGDTVLNIGTSAIKDDSYSGNKNIIVKGSVFGGSETNASEEDKYNYSSVGVSGSATINIDGKDYAVDNVPTLNINGSIYGSGNNSNTIGDKILNISNYGLKDYPVTSMSLQRLKDVYIVDSYFELSGDRDREMGKATIYSLVQIEKLYLLGSRNESVLNGTDLYIRGGATFLKNFYSGTLDDDGNFIPQATIENGSSNLVNENSDNKLYMFTNKLLSISNSETPDRESLDGPGSVNGMTFLGMYSVNREGGFLKGIYDNYKTGDIVPRTKVGEISSADYTYVFGARNKRQTPDEQMKTNGFYTNVYINSSNEEECIARRRYVDVTPRSDSTNWYEWRIGDVPPEIDVPLVATRYSVEGVANASLSLDQLKESVGDNKVEEWRDARMEITEVKTNEFGAMPPNVKEKYDTYLVDKSEIETYNFKVGDDGIIDSNQFFALSMGTTTSGWLDNYKTNLYDGNYAEDKGGIYGENFCTVSENNGDCVGNSVYLYDSTRKQRSLSFWLHHSKNLDFSVAGITDNNITSISLGKVVVVAQFTNPHADPTDAKGNVVVRINLNISMRDGEKDAYGASIAPGKKYEVFNNVTPSITTDSSFSLYQSLYLDMNGIKNETTQEKWSVEDVYKPGNYRALRSSYNFPVGTRITMLDLADKEQYFYEVDSSDHSFSEGIYQYKLSEFYRMGNEGKKDKYNDDMNGHASKTYYHSETINGNKVEIGVEEFIFIVDFSNVTDLNHIDNVNKCYNDKCYMSMVLADSDGVQILGSQQDPEKLNYYLFPYSESNVVTTGGFLDNNGSKITVEKIEDIPSIYASQDIDLELDTDIKFEKSVTQNAVTTIYDEYKLGANIRISRAKVDSDGNPIIENGKYVYEEIPENDNLLGLVLSVNGEYFYPQKDHSIRVKLAGKVTGLTTIVNFDFSNSSLRPGIYRVDVDTFASYDGLYYGDASVSQGEYELILLNDEYGLDVKTASPAQIIHDVNNGKDKNESNVITYNIQTKNGLKDPNLKISLQRKVDEKYSLVYEDKDLADIATDMSFNGNVVNLSEVCNNGFICYNYDIGSVNKNMEIQDSEFKLTLKDGPSIEDKANPSEAKWKSGTYRVVFTLYDGDKLIGSVYEYLIIRSLGIDEEIERSGS